METREERDWRVHGFRPVATVGEAAEAIFELPAGAQIFVLRKLAERLLASLPADERETILFDLEQAAGASAGPGSKPSEKVH